MHEAHQATPPETDPADYWEDRYSSAGPVWSGRVNTVLSQVAAELEPATALDLGCGEGADVLWLAERGWQATGVDISATAVARATQAADAAGLAGRTRFLAADVSGLPELGRFALVTASFLHSPVALARAEILRRAAELVTPGGHLLVTSHSAPPPWADEHAHHQHLPTPQEEVELLALDPVLWELRIAETRRRDAISPTGEHAELEDGVVLARRRA